MQKFNNTYIVNTYIKKYPFIWLLSFSKNNKLQFTYTFSKYYRVLCGAWEERHIWVQPHHHPHRHLSVPFFHSSSYQNTVTHCRLQVLEQAQKSRKILRQ